MTKIEPLVSVIINCYNGGTFVKEAIDSVYAQTYTNWEIIFWDNSSTDDSAEISKAYDCKLKYYFSEKNTSLGNARKSALQKANGKYICFLDTDDLILEHKLSDQVVTLEKSSAALLYGNAILIDVNGKKIGKTKVKDFTGMIIEKLLYRYNINMQTVMFKNEVFSSGDIFIDNDLKYSPDYNLFMKIASVYPVISLNKDFAKYRVHPEALSSKLLKEVSLDGRVTLDYIFNRFNSNLDGYNSARLAAYQKLNYYDAIYYIDMHDYKKAKKSIKEVAYTNIFYFILYMLLKSGFKRNFLFKLLNR